MDLYRSYFYNLANSGFEKINKDNYMSVLIACIGMLHYDNERNRALRFIANICARFGHIGEAYHALKLLSPSELGVCSPLLNSISNPGYNKFMFNIEIITKCNLRCPMCSQGGSRPHPNLGKMMSLDNFKLIYDKIKNITNLIVLVGQGESFLHPDIYKILDYSRETPIYIDTNGSLKLDAEKIVKSNIQTLVFSVDAIDQRMHEKYRIGHSCPRSENGILGKPLPKPLLGVRTDGEACFRQNSYAVLDTRLYGTPTFRPCLPLKPRI
jgi:uncharacterized radical SAM superfamily Fe-S cluster-containing enzyme